MLFCTSLGMTTRYLIFLFALICKYIPLFSKKSLKCYVFASFICSFCVSCPLYKVWYIFKSFNSFPQRLKLFYRQNHGLGAAFFCKSVISIRLLNLVYNLKDAFSGLGN